MMQIVLKQMIKKLIKINKLTLKTHKGNVFTEEINKIAKFK